ncbi:MAG: ABC transporter substrate-binding protein [Provencibacterium sp.]|jgi:peptide/nickel transport system substrate-binding protein|nr:ABC transporter substrate-binding protein [Provencibacterium sp.]
MKKFAVLFLVFFLTLMGCRPDSLQGEEAASPAAVGQAGDTLVYASGDYTRINPAMDEHGEINALLFNGLTAHNGENEVVPALAESWEFDENSCAYTFHLRQGVRWQDGQPFTAGDVRFTIEAIMNPENGSENAPNFEDVEQIEIPDDYTIVFHLKVPNVAFLDYMTMAVLPRHLLEGEDMQSSDFFLHPIGTGPYRLESWETGQAITLKRNEGYFKGTPAIETIIFKIVADDKARAMQLRTGEVDLAQLSPQDAQGFLKETGFTCYRMKTSDYRGILFNFQNPYWQENRDLIPAICYAIDRQAIVETVLLGEGVPAYGPLQRNVYHHEAAIRYDYSPEKARETLEKAGCTIGEDGFYERGGERVGFVLSVGAGDQVRLDIAQIAAQQLREVGIEVSVEIPARVDWGGQMAYLIGWGSPFDADDHTYKVFGTGKGANYSGYSNEQVDRFLTEARASDDPAVRSRAYADFQEALAADPAYAFICYVDACYVAGSGISGISADTVLGHHGVGIFWNIDEWTLAA